MLSDAEIAAYHADGLVVPLRFQLTGAEVDRLREAVDRVVADNPDIESDQLINPHLDAAPPFGTRGHEAFADLVHHDGVLDMVARLLGEDLILWSTHLFCKPAATGREVPWHQDGHYWPIRPLATCTAWVAFDDVDAGNGAMRYIPGSHRMGSFGHRTDRSPRLALHQVVDDEKMDEGRARHVELRAGQLSLHEVHLVHGSAANTSGRRRAGMAIRYMPASSVFRRDLDMGENSRLDWADMPITLVRGRNRQPENDLTAGHPAG